MREAAGDLDRLILLVLAPIIRLWLTHEDSQERNAALPLCFPRFFGAGYENKVRRKNGPSSQAA